MEQMDSKCVLCNITYPFDFPIHLLQTEIYCYKPNCTAQNMKIYLFITEVIEYRKVIREKLTVAQLAKKLHAFYGVRRSTIVFIKTHYWIIS
jgi:hypothetical protein